MKLYFFIKVQHTGDTDLGQADIRVKICVTGELRSVINLWRDIMVIPRIPKKFI